MNNYQMLFPINTVIYGDSYQNAVKNFVKLNYNLKLQELFLADQEKRYKINMKYSRADTRNRVGFFAIVFLLSVVKIKRYDSTMIKTCSISVKCNFLFGAYKCLEKSTCFVMITLMARAVGAVVIL